MQNLHADDLTVWARRFGVDLAAADLERIRSLAEQYLDRVKALRDLGLEGEPLFPPRLGEEAERGA